MCAFQGKPDTLCPLDEEVHDVTKIKLQFTPKRGKTSITLSEMYIDGCTPA